jgi:polysaccharide export outer membrane protein
MAGFWVLLCLAMALAPALARGAAAQAPREGLPPESTSDALNPGDMVRITVWRKPELTGDFLVGTDGRIRHPLYQNVQIAGLPIAAVTEQLRTFLATYETNPQMVVEPLYRVGIGGEVRQPSLYPLPPETSIGQAVALAGGATERGHLDQVRLIRGNREFLLDLTRPDSTANRTRVQSGDQIIVPRRGNALRDVVGPVASIAAAIATVLTFALK